ncbi:DGKD family protein [Megaselia abdita]
MEEPNQDLLEYEYLKNNHFWHETSHARPTYCNICRDGLPGVTFHGFSCEICKYKVHKRCAVKSVSNCKWTTLASIGRDIIEEKDGTIVMPHQWIEGNLPVASICVICKKTCGSVLRLQDWRCLWCRVTIHTACRPYHSECCNLGSTKVSVVPPTCVHTIDDESWNIESPKGNFSPLLVFVNSKSGDNQGVKFLRRFKQLLNPAQVFDLITTGPSLGLRLFRHFDLFRILICSGDGSVGWVLSEIDRFDLSKKCQIAVLPLGTGNDLARVLGWGSSCDDDTQLPQILDKYETGSTKMLDRWSIMVFEKCETQSKVSITNCQEALICNFITKANSHLKTIIQADSDDTILSSLESLNQIIDNLILTLCDNNKKDEQLLIKCNQLKLKFNDLLETITKEEYLLERKELWQDRANSVKKAIYNIVEHSEPGRPKRYQRKLSITPYEALKVVPSSISTSPISSSTLFKPYINIIKDISPVNDNDSCFNNTYLDCISLPVPKQFEDSRRSSSVLNNVPESNFEDDYNDNQLFDRRYTITGNTFEGTNLNHIDSPESNEEVNILNDDEHLSDDISSVLQIQSSLMSNDNDESSITITGEKPNKFGFENIVFEMDNRCDDQKICEPIRYCSLARFVEGGSDIVRKSFKTNSHNDNITSGLMDIKIDHNDTKRITFDESCKKESLDDQKIDENKLHVQKLLDPIRRHSSHVPTYSGDNLLMPDDRKLSVDVSYTNFLNCSPAATRRISCGSLFKKTDSIPSYNVSKLSLNCEHKESITKIDNTLKKMPIINPLVSLPSWPNINTSNGLNFISKCLLANADTLCAAVSPLMDPDETLNEGFFEKCVMNNYFGIGIDAKISLDFHNKREEHPEKCRSRTKNYLWYGVLGSKQLLKNTCKNFEQRVQLECDGQKIPLPSLQGLVILNIPSFMGGINFWGGTKEDDIFLAPSFDDRILEVVAVFGSVQMAASRILNLQHHRIAQCQSVQINILGDEDVPIQVDGEAWLQPPGTIRIIHKNRVQMLCRNRNLEVSLKTWQQKQRQSVSLHRDQTSTTSVDQSSVNEEIFSEKEYSSLFNFIETVYSLIKCVKLVTITHPSTNKNLYREANEVYDALEIIHPNGQLLDAPQLRIKLVDLIKNIQQLYDDCITFFKNKEHVFTIKEELQSKLSVSLANVEMELKKIVVELNADGLKRVYINSSMDSKPGKAFWSRFRSGSITTSKSAVGNWSVNEVVVWLETMNLSEYTESFLRNDIRGKELLTLNRRDLKELDVVKIGHVKRLLQAIKLLE